MPQISVLAPYRHSALSEPASTLLLSLSPQSKREKQVQCVSAVNPECVVSTVCTDSVSPSFIVFLSIFLLNTALD